MKTKLKDLLERAELWPEAVQDEAVRLLLAVEEEQAGVYVISDEEWADLREGLDQADRGEFVPDEVLAEADKRHGA